MNEAYDDVLKRLKEERRRLKLTQREMSSCACMSQVNYSKVETGVRRLSYHEVKSLCDSEIDMHYVFTGLRCSESLRTFFLEYSYPKLLSLLNIFTSVIELRNEEQAASRWRQLLWYAEMFRTISASRRADPGLFLKLRRSLGYNQRDMAEKLGMDVKKLRQLENGRCQPDCELLLRLYTVFGISPAVTLMDRRCMASEIGCLLEHFDFVAADGVFQIVKSLQELPEAL